MHPDSNSTSRSDQNDHQLVLEFNFWTLGVVMPAIAVLGVLANAASVVVLTHRSMRSSPINIYLAGLSTFDGLLLLITLLLYPPLSYCEADGSNPDSLWCQYFFHSALLTYPLSLITQSGSVWTLTAITIDRFIAVTWPLHSREWCTTKRAHWVMLGISAWAVLYNLPAFFELRLVNLPMDNEFELMDDWTNSTFEFPAISSPGHSIIMPTELRQNVEYVIAYKGYCYLIFMLLLPAGTMVILNIFVTISVRKAYRLRKAMSGREEKERRCTIMAILVASTFLVLNSVAFISNLVEIFSTTPNSENIAQTDSNFTSIDHSQVEEQSGHNQSKSTAYLIIVSVGNLLVATNSATNFFIYCALGVRFRNMFCRLFCGRSALSMDIMNNERSYQSLTVRYGGLQVTPTIRRKGSDTETNSTSPMPNSKKGHLAEHGFGSATATAMPFALRGIHSMSSSTYSVANRVGRDKGRFV